MRTRPIKPSFWKNEIIAELDPWARLLFQVLWSMADCRGLLEFRPKKIKADGFPYDDAATVDIPARIDALAERKLVRIYQVGEHKYIEIPNFAKHARPHKDEKQDDTIPAPEQTRGKPELPPAKPESPPSQPVSNGSECPVSGLLVPDSLFPIPVNPTPSDGVGFEKPKFADTATGLAQEFCHKSTRTRGRVKADTPDDVEPVMADLLKAGCTPAEIHTEIHAKRRLTGEYAWEFKKRLLAGVRNRGPTTTKSAAEHAADAKAQREAIDRRMS